ncbi:MAG: hypothetical protein ACREFQ_05275, partial [Stellaceae bacterium]
SEAMQTPRLSFAERAFYLSYWSERGDEKETLLGGLMRFLTPQKYFVVADQGWDGWDLKIARGLWSRALVLVCTENHGGGKRLLRVRCAMRVSRFSALVLRAYALACAAALILNAPLPAAAIGIAGLAHGAYIGWRTFEFGRLMRRIIETVARREGVAPIERSSALAVQGG